MEITSNHLEVVPPEIDPNAAEGGDGDEIAKREENFGYPIGKSELIYLCKKLFWKH
jgi:hypothetical protein